MKNSKKSRYILIFVLLCAIGKSLTAANKDKETLTRDEIKLTASDGDADDRFGYSVSIFGDYILIGVSEDDNGYSSGSAYIFYYDGSSWSEQQKLTASDGDIEDRFGNSVSISGDNILIGAKLDDDNGTSSGSTYIFLYDGLSWVEQQKLIASDGIDGDYFGCSVSISGDYALIGAWGNDNNGSYSGSAYIYHYDGTSWSEQQKLTASDGDAVDMFGHSVSISGDYALIGAFGNDDNGSSSGSAYIYHYDGLSWGEQQKLTASDGAENDWFGWSVSISGDCALIGARNDDDNGSSSGSAYIYYYDETSWEEHQKLTASDGAGWDNFGISVSISEDYALIGTSYGNNYNGSAYIYHYDETYWIEQQKLTASDGAENDRFGNSVSISEDYALIGAWGDDDNGFDSGSAYVFDTEYLLVDPEINVSSSNLITNFPNPFNPATTIIYNLKVASNVRINVFNITGQMITSLVDANQQAGNHSVIWNGKNYSDKHVSSGLYLYKMIVDDRIVDIKKCLLLK